jgi:hypothetical protein
MKFISARLGCCSSKRVRSTQQLFRAWSELGRNEAALKRFHRETRAASAPEHPNTCAVCQIGEYDVAAHSVISSAEEAAVAEPVSCWYRQGCPRPRLSQ